jgi:hypothetical protein
MNGNEEFVRRAHSVAEVMDIQGWIDRFSPERVFRDHSIEMNPRGPTEVAKSVEYHRVVFSEMHRELYDVSVSGDVVAVQLAPQGIPDGAPHLPCAILPATGERTDAVELHPDGVLEGSMIGMLVLYGVGVTVATAAILAYHAISSWVSATWGTIGLIAPRRTTRQPTVLRNPPEQLRVRTAP